MKKSIRCTFFKFAIFQLVLLNYIVSTQSLYYPNQYYNYPFYPFNYPYNQPYNICPESFYFYAYEPILAAVQTKEYILSSGNSSNKITTLAQNTTKPVMPSGKSSKSINKTASERNVKFQSQVFSVPIDANIESRPEGPFWEVMSKTYEKCCSLNRDRIKPILVKDDLELNNELFSSFSNQTHILHHRSQGMFAIFETHHAFQQFDGFSQNQYSVQIMSSTGFYLITKREMNGSPTITPIALSILLNAWPLLLIILVANGYAAIIIWLLDRILQLGHLHQPFTKGTAYGLVWSFFLFTATSLAPRVNLKTWAVRVFTILWMMISMVIVVIFTAMFTTALVMYAMNGQSLDEKIVGINRYSTDRLWLETENTVPVVYDFMNDMFRDLDELKLDYILLDQLYVNFYSELINEKFYVMRHVNRKRSFNVVLRGFNAEQLFCFQTTSKIFSQQWLLGNLSANTEKIKDTTSYFNITDELLYPARNNILITAVVILVMIGTIAVTWQVTCMKPSLDSLGLGGLGGGGMGGLGGLANALRRGDGAGALNRRMRGASARNRNESDTGSFNENGENGGNDDGGTGGPGTGGIRGNNRPMPPGRMGPPQTVPTGGRGGRPGRGGIRSLFGQGGRASGGGFSVRNLIPGGFLTGNDEKYGNTNNNQLYDRSVKFNPLVHNFYLGKSENLYDKALINARDQVMFQSSNKYNTENEVYKTDNWNFYKNDEIVKQTATQLKSAPLSSTEPSDYQTKYPTNFPPNQSYQYPNGKAAIMSTMSIPVENVYSSFREKSLAAVDKSIQTSINSNQSQGIKQDEHASHSISSLAPYRSNQINITKVELNNNTGSILQANDLGKLKSTVSMRKGIILNPATNSSSSIFNQESNTDEITEPSTKYSNRDTGFNSVASTMPYYSKSNNLSTLSIAKTPTSAMNNNTTINSRDLSDTINYSISSRNGTTASMISNPTHKELARSESFYLTEFSNVKL